MKKLIRTFRQISILILAITFIGCEDDDAVLPKVVAKFIHKIKAETGVVTFINISENATNYSWDFGEGSNSTLINPVKAYPPGEYLVTLKATNVAGESDTFVDTIVISDVGAPIITLLGDTTVNINVGGVFNDPGATAMDDLDGDITADIVVEGDVVDVNTAGTYIITYNVSDAAGNAATQRTRTVIVTADTVAPVITLTGSSTINIAIGEAFTDPGATATDDVDGDITANIVVAGDAVDVNTAATYTITYNVSDAAGNAATEVTRTVIVGADDSIAPVITLIGNATVNVTVGGTFTDPGATASDNVDGNITGNIVVGGDTIDVNTVGTYVITYNVSDAAGNAATEVTRTVIVAVAGPSNGNLAANGDFETGTDSGWFRFQNRGTAILDNTINNGGSWSGKIATNGASNPAFKQERIGAGTVASGDVVQVKFDHIGEILPEGGVFNVLLFGEGAAGASFTHVFNPTPALSSSWKTFTGTFTIPSTADVSEGISFLIESVCGGAAGCSVTANIDNVSVTLNP